MDNDQHNETIEPGADSKSSRTATTDVRSFLETTAQDDVWNSIAALTFEDENGAGDELASFPDAEVAYEAPSSMDEEAALAALQTVSRLNKSRGKKKEQYVKNLTDEDFEEGPERISYMLIKANVDAMLDAKVKPDVFLEAAQWIFGRDTEAFSFDECCSTLSVRKDVLRLRIQFEFWRKWRVFPIEFPFMIARVPEILEGEIYIVAGEEGYDIARTAWLQPGIRTEKLLSDASAGNVTDAYIKALELLSSRYIMSQHGDNWWLTGRNPIMRELDLSTSTYKRFVNQVSWSKMF